MERRSRGLIKAGGGIDLAFAVVVLASYLATFSGVEEATPIRLALMIFLGMTYLAVGIYGYAFSIRIDSPPAHLTYFVVQLLVGGLIVYFSQGAGLNAMVLLPLAGQAVVLLPQKQAYTITVLVLVIYIAAVYAFSGSIQAVTDGLPVFFAGLVFIVVFTQMAVSEEKARAEVERLLGELTEANKQLRDYVSQVEELSITKERNRLAREIHDGLGHYLTTIYMELQAGRAVLKTDSGRADELFEKAQGLAQDALLDVRGSVASLRADATEDQPLADMIQKLLSNTRMSGLDVDFRIVGRPRSVSPQAKLTLFRAAQEGINNTCKHASAAKVALILDYTRSDQVMLSVQDDGQGADEMNGGFGLVGLQERANLLDGTLEIDTRPGHGFLLRMAVPG